MHPRTRNILKENGMTPGFAVIDPVGYFDMVELLRNCEFVITDSGGLQKEAFFFEKHCLVARDETEWIELVELGCNVLVGASKSAILENSLSFSDQSEKFKARPYGQGDAASQIARILKTAVKR
jgi:UDP-GlcNAc3NAcA epimerase